MHGRINNIKWLIGVSGATFRQYRGQIILLAALGFAGGILEGIGVNALIPVFSFAAGEGFAAGDAISRFIEGAFRFVGIPFRLGYLIAIAISLFLGKAVALYFFNVIKVRITADYELRLRSDLMASTLRARWLYLAGEKIGHLENVLMTDVRLASTILQKASNLIMAFSSITVYSLIAVSISARITLLALGFGAVIALLFKRFVVEVRAVAMETGQFNKRVAHYVNESVLGMKIVKAMDAGESVRARAQGYFDRLKELKIRLVLLTNWSAVALQPLAVFFILVLFAFSYRSPGFQLASFMVVVYLVYRIFQQVNQVLGSLYAAADTEPYLKTALAYQKRAIEAREDIGGTEPFAFSSELAFRDVSFSYAAGESVLRGVSFEIERGEMVGLIGPSGAGKTTIVDLLLQLFAPTTGEITVDGKNVDRIALASWRASVGYIPQDIFLMNDTIAANIRFYDNSISDEAVRGAARDAAIADRIERLPQKFETVVGERGIRFSLGERQRIAIARVLARKPAILILDEATSSLDSESEREIQKVIESLKGRVTIIVIAHRLSTVMHCDRLLVLDRGAIAESGAPEELLKRRDSYFYKLIHLES